MEFNINHIRNRNYFYGAVVIPCGDEIWCWDGMHGNMWIYNTSTHKTETRY